MEDKLFFKLYNSPVLLLNQSVLKTTSGNYFDEKWLHLVSVSTALSCDGGITSKCVIQESVLYVFFQIDSAQDKLNCEQTFPTADILTCLTQVQLINGGKQLSTFTQIKYSFEVFVLYLSISLFSYFVLLLNYISEANIVFLLHYIYLITLVTLQIQISNTKYNQEIKYDVILLIKIKLN